MHVSDEGRYKNNLPTIRKFLFSSRQFFNARFTRIWPSLAKCIQESKAAGENDIDLSKAAHLYWMSHDLMWTYNIVTTTADRTSTLHGLQQYFHHALCIVFQGKHARKSLTACKVLGTLQKTIKELPRANTTIPVSMVAALKLAIERVRTESGAILNSKTEGYIPYTKVNKKSWLQHKDSGKT